VILEASCKGSRVKKRPGTLITPAAAAAAAAAADTSAAARPLPVAAIAIIVTVWIFEVMIFTILVFFLVLDGILLVEILFTAASGHFYPVLHLALLPFLHRHLVFLLLLLLFISSQKYARLASFCGGKSETET